MIFRNINKRVMFDKLTLKRKVSKYAIFLEYENQFCFPIFSWSMFENKTIYYGFFSIFEKLWQNLNHFSGTFYQI